MQCIRNQVVYDLSSFGSNRDNFIGLRKSHGCAYSTGVGEPNYRAPVVVAHCGA